MNELYQKYQKLNIDGSWIGLNVENNEPYFCTPIGAAIIGWDNGIHYCFIDGFGEMVFAVNPDTCCDYPVYPLAKNFLDFLRLIVAVHGTNLLQQIILWDRETYTSFLNDPNEVEWAARAEVVEVIDTIRKELAISPMGDPFGYVEELQKNFPYEKIPFSNEYYETLGLQHPDETEPENDSIPFATITFSIEK